MKDKSKKLTVVNTGKKPSEKKEVQQVIVQPSSSSSSHAPGFNPNLYLLKSVWDSVFEIKTDVSGQMYIFGKLPIVTKYGITMYADDGSLNLPSIYEGLPIDGVTLYWDNGVLKAKGGEGGGGGVADSIAWANVYGKPSWVTDTKPIYNYSEIKNTPDLSVFVTDTALSNTLADYATLTYLTGELKEYVTLDGEQDITGIKDFINGLKIGGIELIKKQDDVVYLDGNLVVKGGITMYGDGEGGSSVPLYSTLGSLENVDKDAIDAVASVDRVLFQSAGSNVWSWKALSEIGGGSSGGGPVSGDYLPLTGGTIKGVLSIRRDTSVIHFGNSGTINYGYLGFKDVNTPVVFEHDGIVNYTILHSGNYSSYALPLSGGTLTGDLTTSNGVRLFLNTGGDGIYIYNEGISFHNNSNNWVASNMGFYSDGSVSLCPNGGNVGIGTTSPEHKLHVYGTMRSYDVSTDKVSVTLNNSEGFSESNALNYNRAWFANTKEFVVPYNSVQVALGWSNWLKGEGYHTRYSISSIRFGGWGGMSLAVGANDAGTHRGCTLELWGSGTISAGGNLIVSGGITMYSDIRKKTKLQDVELSLSQIANAPLIEHYYNSDQNKTTHVGSIAQYWAGLNDWFCKLDNEGYYTMEIQNCALASAISIARHLEKYESKTDKKIRQLKKRISQLEDELELLKKGV